jgi:hypothetical protein
MAILSHKMKSPLHGAQYLHAPIPWLTGDPVDVSYQLRGDSFAYREKVYGEKWDGKVSPEDLEVSHKAWDIRDAYDRLWSLYSDRIVDQQITGARLRAILERDQPDIVINSIPRERLCMNAAHVFGFTDIVAAGDAPALGIRIPFQCPDNTVICNGLENPSWYRMSRVFGHTTVEWPGSVERVPVATAARWRKPTYTDCDCWADIVHVGRYGTWQKGVLSHEAYQTVLFKILSMAEGKGCASEEVRP